MQLHVRVPFLLSLTIMSACAVTIPPAPKARVDPVVDVVHGVRVPDPYRWLEDGESKETKAFVDAQNARTRAVLDALPGRAALARRIEALMRIGTLTAPVVRKRPDGSLRFFYKRRSAQQNQPVLYVRDGLRGQDRVLVDPAGYAKDGTATIDWSYPSPDGALVAYGVSEGGSEQSVLRVRDVATGRDLPDVIERTRACSLEWLPDGSGFYYTRYAAKGTVPDAELGYHRRVYFHALGTDPSKDPLVFGADRDMKDWANVDLSPNGRWLVVSMHMGFSRSEIFVLDRQTPGAQWAAIAKGTDALYDASALDDRVIVRTNEGAPRYRLFSVDPAAPAERTPLLPEGADVLASFTVAGADLVVSYTRDAASRVARFDLRTGAPKGDLALPAVGSVWGLSSRWNGDDVFVGFTSFTVAPAVYRYALSGAAPAAELWERVVAPIKADDFEIKSVRYPSKDGTPVTMFIVHRKGIPKDGARPTYLYGYGGFNVDMTPYFLGATYLFLERGGVFAMPTLRGGGEYGEAWHKAGMRERKQNTFDDFIAAGEWLVKNQYTKPERLVAAGGSNGGLLVGAVVTQRPDLFKAAVCMVPLLDMTRFHRFLIAKLWTGEYGSPEVAEEFKWLHAYSPYHRVTAGTRYPSVLLTTAESDTRVDPLHARKMAALLQAASRDEAARPVLLRVETRAGHGAGKPVTKLVEELTDRWAYVLWQLGL